MFPICSYIKDILEQLATNVAVEIQQRGAEYKSLFERPQEFRFGIMERMPVVKRGSAADHSLSDVEGGGGRLTVPNADDTDDLLGYHGEKRDASKKPKPKHSDVRPLDWNKKFFRFLKKTFLNFKVRETF